MAEELRDIVLKGRERLWGEVSEEKIRAMEAVSRKYQGFAH